MLCNNWLEVVPIEPDGLVCDSERSRDELRTNVFADLLKQSKTITAGLDSCLFLFGWSHGEGTSICVDVGVKLCH